MKEFIMKAPKHVWQMRAVQMDLARQMETLEYIFEFIDFIAEHGYNTLFLYLEARVKTEVFPYPADSECYTKAEMKQVVDYAGQKGIEVIPVLSTLGHAEKFLKYPEMAHLAELRDGKKGRHGNHNMGTFCPSQPELFEFFDKYIGELAEVFPSRFFHAGLDEDWDIGYCNLCRARAEGEEGQSGIFSKLLQDTHSILSKYGKRMIIWDDMFEFYPEALKEAPRDIVMCCWHYDNLVDIPKAHFANRRREDLLAEYEAMGFESIFGPCDWMSRNTETFTEYASHYNCLGGLVTTWEKSCSFLWESYPNIAFAGKLWKNEAGEKADEIMSSCIKSIFGIDDPIFVNAVKTFCGIKRRSPAASPSNYLRGPVTELEFERSRIFVNIFDILSSYQDKINSRIGLNVFEDMMISIKGCMLNDKLRECLPVLVSPSSDDETFKNAEADFEDCLKELDEFRYVRGDQWQKYRNGVTPCCTDEYYLKLQKTLQDFVETNRRGAVLHARLMLPDMYSAQRVAFFVKYNGEDKWEKVTEGVYKAFMEREACYMYSFPVQNGIPEKIRIETCGYAGQGFTFVEIESTSGNYVPASIEKAEGNIISPENVLVNDLQWCFMGERDTTRSFLNPKLAEAKHVLQISLKKA
jgi:hypothetical protein